ncbi:hypothetical protein [Micromonospora chalcea]|uniref:hypothetical protein n=1 Tax=Micromonospora chalcea TaxID=1874 RepID=UPI003D7080F0
MPSALAVARPRRTGRGRFGQPPGGQAAMISASRWSARSPDAVRSSGTRLAAPWKWCSAIAENGDETAPAVSSPS